MAGKEGDDWDSYDADDFVGGSGRRVRKPDPGFDIDDVEVIRETDAALLVRGKGLSSDPFGVQDAAEEGWIPKSQVHERSPLGPDCGVGAKGTIVITKWLAEKRGLV